MQKRKFDELISHFNRKVSDMSIDQKYKMELLGMISAIGFAHEKELSTNLASLGTDCISRQAAISAICNACGKIDCDKMDKCEKLQLSPANISETPNSSDMISRQAAIDAIGREKVKVFHELYDEAWNDAINGCKEVIEQLPPIQPDIVRCKDCKYWIPYDWMFSEVWRSKNMADYPEDEIGCNWCDMAMKANDFCSRREKREVTT